MKNIGKHGNNEQFFVSTHCISCTSYSWR